MALRIVCISDTHNRHQEVILPPGDMIIHAGDATGRGTLDEVIEFIDWYSQLPYKYKIFVAGNHDWLFETDAAEAERIVKDAGIIYLNDSGIEIEGIKFWASPVQPEFCHWAFNRARTKEDASHPHSEYEFIGKHWDMIPNDTDVLITHGPPAGTLDRCPQSVGCHELLKAIDRVRPKYHIFGHIHEGRGREYHKSIGCTFINASNLDGRYVPYRRPAEVFDI